MTTLQQPVLVPDVEQIFAKAYGIYERSGQFAVHDAVGRGELPCDGWHYCEPCEIESPIFANACLVCASELRFLVGVKK